MTQPLTLDDLGLPAVTDAVIDPAQVQRIAATLDRDPGGNEGDRLPSLWHWAFFTPTVPTAGLGGDGHARLSSPLLVEFPRRMWGAGTVNWIDHLTVGERATRTTTLVSSKTTSGGSGPLLIVGLEHRYQQFGHDVIVEQQSIVYRGQGDPVPLPVDGPAPVPGVGVTQLERCPDPALLFRFSAITFNAHRIHYDAPYAHEVEGYPGLVVHGPLTSLQLAHHVEACTGRRLARWQFKATAPMFSGCRQWFQCDPVGADGGGDARVLRNDGAVAMQAQYSLRASHD